MICPICHKEFRKETAAISRKGNKQCICPDCGTREALDDIQSEIMSEDTKELVYLLASRVNKAQEEHNKATESKK